MVTPPPTRSATLPALVYVLAAFGVISGSYGALNAVQSAALFAKPREVYLSIVTAKNEPLKGLVDDKTLERYDAHEADARYGRRNAALPIAGIGIVLSCLMFAGAMRAMRGDGWGLSAWRFAAAANIPYQLVSLAFAWVIARDMKSALAELPPMAKLWVGSGAFYASIGFCAVAIVYYGICVIYLRTPGVRTAFSVAAGRTPPSA